MADMNYPYDPDLPYVVTHYGSKKTLARFAGRHFAEIAVNSRMDSMNYQIIDTTPKPRVPDDALWIAYSEYGTSDVETWELIVAARQGDLWFSPGEERAVHLEDLPGVTPETVFIVLEERKS